jgi:FkbM family methyltransferase
MTINRVILPILPVNGKHPDGRRRIDSTIQNKVNRSLPAWITIPMSRQKVLIKMESLKFNLGHLWFSLIGFLRFLPKHPGFAIRLFWVRLQYFLTRKFGSPLATPDGFTITTTEELISYWSFFVEGEGSHSKWLTALASTNHPLVLDVGANAGLFTHLIWNQRRDVEIIAFDPLPKMAAKLEQWKKRTGANLTVQNQAVSDHCGTMSFYLTSDHDTSASLQQHTTATPPISVPVVTLDSILAGREVLLAKFDVEGVEVSALAGAREMLKKTRFVILEAHTPQALASIRTELGPAWQCHRVGSSDYFFWRESIS